jgi:hypothetical protein
LCPVVEGILLSRNDEGWNGIGRAAEMGRQPRKAE